MKIEVSPGEAADRVCILRLKVGRFVDHGKRAAAAEALSRLEQAWLLAGLPPLELLPGWAELVRVNEALWDLEAQQRSERAEADAAVSFAERARRVYELNDRRAALKRTMDASLGSEITEQKEYGPAT